MRAQHLPHRHARDGVEAGGGLVEEEDARLVHEAARDLDAPAHAAGEVLDRRLAPLRELDRLQQLVDQALALAARHAVELGEDEQVLLDAQLEVAGQGLRDDADRAPHVVGAASLTSKPFTSAVPAVGGSSVVSMRMSVDLPAPFGPSRPKISPSSTREAHPVHGGEVAEALDDLADVDRRHRRPQRTGSATYAVMPSGERAVVVVDAAAGSRRS